MDSNSEQIAKQFAEPIKDSEIERMSKDAAYAKDALARLQSIDLSQLDLITKNNILANIKLAQAIVDGHSRQNESHNKDEEEKPAEQQEPALAPREKSADEIKAEAIVAAQKALHEKVAKHLAAGNIIAIGDAGEELASSQFNGKARAPNVIGFAGHNQEALEEVADSAEQVYENFRRLGFMVRNVIVDGIDSDGKAAPKRFFAVILPEGFHHHNPLTMNKDEIMAAVAKQREQAPPTKINREINNDNEFEPLQKFRNLVNQAVAICKGDKEDLEKFREEQVVSWWKELRVNHAKTPAMSLKASVAATRGEETTERNSAPIIAGR